MFKTLKEDIDAVVERDPAVKSRLEVVFCYPGFHAVLFYRLSRVAWRAGFGLTGRFISHLGRFFTGIEIHPSARIGKRFFIDHGMGVVVGETSIIGHDVTLYHGVTLGGISPAVDSSAQVDQQRHPTLGDGVIVGSGAQILGPITVGAGARVGSNSVVLKDVAPGTTVAGIPARVMLPKPRPDARRFEAYGTPPGGINDPVARMVEGLLEQVAILQNRVAELERRADAPDTMPVGEDDAILVMEGAAMRGEGSEA